MSKDTGMALFDKQLNAMWKKGNINGLFTFLDNISLNPHSYNKFAPLREQYIGRFTSFKTQFATYANLRDTDPTNIFAQTVVLETLRKQEPAVTDTFLQDFIANENKKAAQIATQEKTKPTDAPTPTIPVEQPKQPEPQQQTISAITVPAVPKIPTPI